MSDASNDFGNPPTIFEEEYLAARTPTESPSEESGNGATFSTKSASEKSRSLLANRDRFKESAAQRSAAIAWASLAQSDAIDRQTAVLERAAIAAERQADLTERLLAEQRMTNQLSFYAMSESDFLPRVSLAPAVDDDGNSLPDSVYVQVKRNLGIIAAKPAADAADESDDDEDDFL